MAWIKVSWQLRIFDPEEGLPNSEPRVDEPSLQFALVTIFNRIVRLHGYTTGNVLPRFESPGFDSSARVSNRVTVAAGSISSKNVPTFDNPYFGFVVRAVEQDRSNNRVKDNNDFYEAVRVEAQRLFDIGEIPTEELLETAANSVTLRDRLWRDDDDFLGVNARVFPNLGIDWWPQNAIDESTRPYWMTIYNQPTTDARFIERSNTEYRLNLQCSIVMNDPDGPRLIGDRLENA
tara:strand:- start:516 stop:1217 length:702 start_codon:yes stop_codon:yes gene_type:complete